MVASAILAGCRQDMHDQPRMYPLRGSAMFADGRSARPLVQGTVARGHLREDAALYSGKGADGKPLDAYPFPVTEQVLRRGQERFNIYCTPCHDRAGTGNGMIVQRGFRRPPSFHIDRLRQAPPGHIVDTIANGFGAMPEYAGSVSADDRWAIAAYVKTLQFAGNAPAAELTPEARGELQPAGAPPQAQPGPPTRIPVPERPERDDRK
jgi:mono/diheme cytochrome c family protein